MLNFPAGHLSFWLLSFSERLDGISMISILPNVQSLGRCFLPMEVNPTKTWQKTRRNAVFFWKKKSMSVAPLAIFISLTTRTFTTFFVRDKLGIDVAAAPGFAASHQQVSLWGLEETAGELSRFWGISFHFFDSIHFGGEFEWDVFGLETLTSLWSCFYSGYPSSNKASWEKGGFTGPKTHSHARCLRHSKVIQGTQISSGPYRTPPQLEGIPNYETPTLLVTASMTWIQKRQLTCESRLFIELKQKMEADRRQDGNIVADHLYDVFFTHFKVFRIPFCSP